MHTKHARYFIFCIAASSLLLYAPLILAEDFTADIVYTGLMGTRPGKLYVAKDKARMDTPESIVITRADTKTTIVLLSGAKTYLEQPFDPSNFLGAGVSNSNMIEKRFEGQETIEGVSADKYVLMYEMMGKQQVLFQWVKPGSEVPVRTSAEDGSWTIDYKNVVRGKVDAGLFEIPAGYKKFALQGTIMDTLSKAISVAEER